MAQFPQFPHPAQERHIQEDGVLKAKLASSFRQLLRRTWNSGLFSLFFVTQIHFQRTQR